ncbi:MAG: aldo/keto reductase [Clostridiales bacterium]|jgi:predicted aldo/keto reductase-like oxidoreductase|nr:aldo/keto reductase [Clostridiales bacterium]
MDKRKMRNGETVSRLGMGLMRLPEAEGQIDYKRAEEMIDTLMAAGVTYYDTAFFYHGGHSEEFANKALISRYPRHSFTIATKMPLGEAEKAGSPEIIFNGQLEKLGVDFIDYYLMHGINWGGFEYAQRLGADTYLKKMKEEGKIRYLGFSFHGPADDLPKVLDAFEWDFCQVQLNYFDWDLGEGKKLYEAAHSRNVPLVVMEPVRGGGLSNCHPDVKKVFTDANPEASVASWALRWVGSLEGVDIVLSGMSNIEQVNDNIAMFSPLKTLTEKEYAVIKDAMKKFRELPLIGCTECRYCEKCPQNISIHKLFGGYNDKIRFGSSWYLMNYRNWEKDKLADKCINCGVCEAACPQGIKITEKIKEVFENYT